MGKTKNRSWFGNDWNILEDKCLTKADTALHHHDQPCMFFFWMRSLAGESLQHPVWSGEFVTDRWFYSWRSPTVTHRKHPRLVHLQCVTCRNGEGAGRDKKMNINGLYWNHLESIGEPDKLGHSWLSYVTNGWFLMIFWIMLDYVTVWLFSSLFFPILEIDHFRYRHDVSRNLECQVPALGIELRFLDHDLMFVFFWFVWCCVLEDSDIQWRSITISTGRIWKILNLKVCKLHWQSHLLAGPWARRHSMVALQYLAQWLLGQVQRHLQKPWKNWR